MDNLILWMPRGRMAYTISDWDGNILDAGCRLSALECLERVLFKWRDIVGEAIVEGWRKQTASE